MVKVDQVISLKNWSMSKKKVGKRDDKTNIKFIKSVMKSDE